MAIALPLDDFNAMDAADAASIVAVWAAVPAWIDAILDARPYASIDALADRAASLAAGWAPADLDAALAHHPRIGQRAAGAGAEAAASRTEQSAMSSATDAVSSAIAEGNAAYEERFGRVFLIRAAGRSPEEILGELRRRLTNDDDAETAEATVQLGEIAVLRLRSSIHPGGPA
jgi:2-oxo-4-hydroxy-4-carboxy-5-ureidoimidazoline decarboxylase